MLKDLKDAFEALLKQLFAIPAQIVQKIGAVVSPGKPTRARGRRVEGEGEVGDERRLEGQGPLRRQVRRPSGRR